MTEPVSTIETALNHALATTRSADYPVEYVYADTGDGGFAAGHGQAGSGPGDDRGVS